MNTVISRPNPKDDPSQNQTHNSEEKMQDTPMAADTDLFLEHLIAKGWVSPQSRQGSKIEKENTIWRWGFRNAFMNYFFFPPSRYNPEVLVTTLQKAGFKKDWHLSQRQVAVARLTIKHLLWPLFREEPQEAFQTRVQSLFDMLLAAYNSQVNQEEDPDAV